MGYNLFVLNKIFLSKPNLKGLEKIFVKKNQTYYLIIEDL